MIETAYISKVGRDFKVSPHFTLGEIASKDGADKVLYDTELLDMWENVRSLLGGDGVCVVKPNSWYRTPAHNRAQGGASKSQHIYGTAADMVVYQNGKIVDAKLICCLLQDLGFPGIAYISPRAVHSDNRAEGTYRGDERKGYSDNVKDFYEYFGVKKAEVQALILNPPKEESEEEEMTQQQFNMMMNNWISEQAAKAPNDWSAEAREWAEKNKIIAGTGAGFSYLSYCTREQMVQFLYNLYTVFIAKGESADEVLNAMIKALEGLKK